MTVTFKPNARFVTTFGAPGGMTGKWLKRQAQIVQVIAKAEVGKSTGKLQRSIKVGRVSYAGRGLEVDVKADAKIRRNPGRSYALIHHEGSRPHTISAAPGRALHWGGRRGPTVVAVRHPGTKPNPYLARGLRLMMRRHKGRGSAV